MSTDTSDHENANGSSRQDDAQRPRVTETMSRPPDHRRPCEGMPERMGPYKILDVLGEGGMGVVYLAEQTEPIRRRVALKIIKLGMDTKQVIARFETERQALAMMNHPNVARIFDAGATEEGRPYFLMEHVEGIPITRYCDERRLNTEERLTLFTQVCQAIQHAHQKGIIHRDIKPSNVLVAGQNGQVASKVIDFGVAKAIERHLTERTFFTEQGQLIGTPAYMSPEQVEGGSLDIDTRTDIYSLGVLLYELLAGALPFDPKSLRDAGLAEIQRIIREEEPPKPSARLSALGDESGTVAENRGTDLRSLAKQLRGDLDWIIMRAMDKDRTRRYEAASALADDIGRHLNHVPVEAGPPSKVYRLKKFVRRNKGPVAAVVAIFAVLSGGVAIATHLYLRAESERQRAVRAELEQNRERERAEEARDDSDAVVKFLSDMLAAVTPEEQGTDVSVREVLDRAAEQIGEKFADQPLIEARLRATIGWTYRGLGLYDKAEAHLAEGAVLYHREKGRRHPSALSALNALASVIGDRGDYTAAGARHRAVLEIQRRVLGEEHPDTLGSMNNLAVALDNQGKYTEAEELWRKTLDIRGRTLGEEHPDTLMSMNNLAVTLRVQGRYAEAEELNRKTLEIQSRVLGDDHPHTLMLMGNLANVLYNQGKYAEAEALHRKHLEIERRVLGDEHPKTLSSMNNLANALDDQGKYTEAEKLYRQTLVIQRRVLGDEHPETLRSMNNLANALWSQGKYAEAEEMHRDTLDIMRRVLGEEHPGTLTSMHNLASSLHAQGRYAEAEELDRQTLEIRRRVLGEEHPDTLRSMYNLASALQHQGKYTEAEKLHRETLDIRRRVLGEEHPDTLRSMNNLALALQEQGKFAEAENLNRETLDMRRRVLGEEHPNTLGSMSNLASTLHDQARHAEAEALALESYSKFKATQGESAVGTMKALKGVIKLYESWDTAEPGKGYADKAAKWRAKVEEEGTKGEMDEAMKEQEPSSQAGDKGGH